MPAPALLVRPATPDDHEAYARLTPELGVPDPPPPRERYLEAILPGALVAEIDGAVAGVTWARVRGPWLHVVHLITDPSHRRSGVGRALLAAAAARGRSLGLDRWMLTVKPENTAARALYASVGFHEAGASTLYRLPWRAVDLLPSPPPGLVVAPLAPEVDALPTLGLAPGELAAFRAIPDRRFVGASEGPDLVGLASFDPAFPGAGLFRVREAAVARALLDGLRPLARPDDAHLFVHAEQAPLADALAGAGAEVVMRTLRLEGSLSDVA